MNDHSSQGEYAQVEQQQNNRRSFGEAQDPVEDTADLAEPRPETALPASIPVLVPMPQSYIGRWLLYLDDIEERRLPPQRSYHCWCQTCFDAEYSGDKDAGDPELDASSTGEVRAFIQRHQGHDVTFTFDGDQEYSDLQPRARNILLGEAIYRRYWVGAMSDQAIQELSGVGRKIFSDIRMQIPCSGPPASGTDTPSLKWERCPTCYGTGLKLSDTALAAAIQQVSDLEQADAEAHPPQPVPSIEESLTRLTSAIEEINSRFAVIEKDRRQGLSRPRILMSLDDAAKAVGVRQSVIWEAIQEGDLPFVRLVKGFPMVRSEALQEWLKWHEQRVVREPEPYVPPPESLCRRCGEHQYYGGSAQLHLCRECHQQLKQERMEEKERKRAERLSRRKQPGQP